MRGGSRLQHTTPSAEPSRRQQASSVTKLTLSGNTETAADSAGARRPGGGVEVFFWDCCLSQLNSWSLSPPLPLPPIGNIGPGIGVDVGGRVCRRFHRCPPPQPIVDQSSASVHFSSLCDLLNTILPYFLSFPPALFWMPAFWCVPIRFLLHTAVSFFAR